MIGLRVVCIKSQDLDSRLQIGKIFTVRGFTISQRYYIVVSDEGEKVGWISADNFKPISEIREEKLNQILNETKS